VRPDYKNTHFEKRPKPHITAIPHGERSRNDFLISIDVFERVPPPVSRAFVGVAAPLKPGGVLILSVPYTLGDRTVEL
jgi:hypothetical protein